jgi:DNA-binding PadR family transcriptional regulator
MAVLLTLADGELHGYGIIKEVERQTAGWLRPGAGSLYAALQRMVDDELIEEVAAPASALDARRRYYGATRFGLDVARAEAIRLAEVVRTAGQKKLLSNLRLAYGR